MIQKRLFSVKTPRFEFSNIIKWTKENIFVFILLQNSVKFDKNCVLGIQAVVYGVKEIDNNSKIPQFQTALPGQPLGRGHGRVGEAGLQNLAVDRPHWQSAPQSGRNLFTFFMVQVSEPYMLINAQIAQPLITEVLWKNIMKKFPYIVGDENPHNDKIQELFGDQGGH